MNWNEQKPRRVLAIMILAGLVMLPTIGCGGMRGGEGRVVSFQMSDADIADTIFKRLVDTYGDDLEPSKLPKAQRVVLLVYHTHGILGNGGFQYLFEADLPGDPEYLLTRAAFQSIAATEASRAFEAAFAVFPNATPPEDIESRLAIWQEKYDLRDALEDEESPDAIYFSAMDEVVEKLTEYIRDHESEFSNLL